MQNQILVHGCRRKSGSGAAFGALSVGVAFGWAWWVSERSVVWVEIFSTGFVTGPTLVAGVGAEELTIGVGLAT